VAVRPRPLEQAREVFINLVSNAFDSVRDSAVGPREVEIRASWPEPGQIRIAVSDSGRGIDLEIMPRLFDAFFTTKPKGMGMGLAIVRSIVENHGGRLWATRNPDPRSSIFIEVHGCSVADFMGRSMRGCLGS
jgi:signal transduction histidine kinase